MFRNKKFLLLFLCIPAYACYLYILFLFEKTSLPWDNLICFSGFIAAAVSVLTIKNKTAKIACVAVIHAGLLLSAFFHPQGIKGAKQSILAYLFFCATSLLLIACFTGDKPSKSKKNGGRKTKNPGNAVLLKRILYIFPAALAIFFTIYLFADGKAIEVALHTEGLFFLFLLLFFVFCCRRLSNEKTPIKVQDKTAMCLMAVFSALHCGMCIFYFHQYDGNALLLTFPLFLATIICFTAFPSARNAAFCFLLDD